MKPAFTFMALHRLRTFLLEHGEDPRIYQLWITADDFDAAVDAEASLRLFGGDAMKQAFRESGWCEMNGIRVNRSLTPKEFTGKKL